jgi:hypothetical protein
VVVVVVVVVQWPGGSVAAAAVTAEGLVGQNHFSLVDKSIQIH